MDAALFIRSALTAARTLAGKEVRVSSGGVTVVDSLGGQHPLESQVTPPSSDAIADGLKTPYRYYREKLPEEVDIPGHGAWACSEKDGMIVLKSKRQRGPCLEAFATVDAESVASLRRLYKAPGVDIVVAVEGDARARDVALALASELNLSGHRSALLLPPDNRGYGNGGQTREMQEGPDIFGTSADAPWSVELLPPKASLDKAAKPSHNQSRVVVFNDDRSAWRYSQAKPEQLGSQTRPTALVAISIEKSTPVARIVLSEAAAALSKALHQTTDGPWIAYNARKAKAAAIPRAPKTWHPTTEAVAEAFLARKAPRGMVSNGSLFFHGPIAFSIYYANPVAAIVDAPSGPVIFMGRSSTRGGTKAGTISMAQGDVEKAAIAAGVPVVSVGKLTDFLTLDGHPLDGVARDFEHKKDEVSYSNSCLLDQQKLAAYLLARKQACELELERVERHAAPTYTKSSAWHGLKAVAELRDMLAARFDLPLPDVGDTLHFEEKRAEAYQAAVEWKKSRSEAKRLSVIAPEDTFEDGAQVAMEEDADFDRPGPTL
ncbi:hypothetical protein [Rhizobium leguminosarum]|uniref:hypothetical protein n=1 Tax=Rhizobium leguminosarum TaxID=384 RepID=UPI002E1643D6|nr:hypothetical protein U8Q02_36405 [Rhizobium leguminosarum]